MLTGSTGAILAELGGQTPASRPALPHQNPQIFPPRRGTGDSGVAGPDKAWPKPAFQPTLPRPAQSSANVPDPASPNSRASRRRPTVLSTDGEDSTGLEAATSNGRIRHDARQYGSLAGPSGGELTCEPGTEALRQHTAVTWRSEGLIGRSQALGSPDLSAGTTQTGRAGTSRTCGVDTRDALCRIAKVWALGGSRGLVQMQGRASGSAEV